jgi:hypothetical protein
VDWRLRRHRGQFFMSMRKISYSWIRGRVARFFLVQHTKTGKEMYQMAHRICKPTTRFRF